MASRTSFPGTATNTTHLASEDNQLPGGLIGYASTSTNQTGIGATITDLTGLSQAVTVGASRAIRITGQLMVSSTATDLVTLHVREGTTTLNMARLAWSVANTGETLYVEAVVMAPSAGSHTYKLSLVRESGTGSLATAVSGGTRDGVLKIFDDGPSF